MVWWVLIILGAIIAYGLFEYHWLTHKNLKLTDFGIEEVPQSLQGKRIIYVSDFQFDHTKRGFLHHAADNLIQEINELNPDVVLLGGDYIHQKSKDAPLIFDYLTDIKAEKYAVLGNHDYRDYELVINGLKAAGVHTLINEYTMFHGMVIVGVDDYLQGVPVYPVHPKGPVLLLTHNPDYIEKVPRKVDAALAGHLHGGQVTLFGKYAPITHSEMKQELVYGLKHRPNGSIYITSGVGGTVGFLPVRLFARPEIVIIDC